jgi:hypothetical protein
MKRICIFPVLLLVGCTSIHEVSPERFKTDIQDMNTFYWCEYIGQANGNAYILRKRAPLFGKRWKQDILCTKVNGLGPDFLKQLEERKKEK